LPFQKGAPWPKFRGDAAQTGASTVHASKTGGAFWSYQTGKGVFSSPVIGADGTVYVGSADRTFYALNADGSLRWKLLTGEIIDSAALLDDQGRVYFGSGDGKLRALDASTGAAAWTMTADDPSVNKSFINWFEGNVAIGANGDLYVPNDNFFVYSVDRSTGNVHWRYKMPDQTWSLPAVDAKSGNLFVGNNNLLPILGKNTFGIDPNGNTTWSAVTLGTIAASPLLTPDGRVVVGGFDGYIRAYDAASGSELWNVATRDHVYASPARQPNGTIVEPSTDGTVYGINPSTGAIVWTYDAGEPIRSSPAVDADGNVYFGCGDGRLYALSADGTLRWAMKLIDDARNDLNASPALGTDAIVIAGESGQIFHVPYDWCLRDAGKADPHCTAPTPLPSTAALLYTSRFGALGGTPSSLDPNEPVTLTLVVRDGGTQKLAILDPTSVAVTVTPQVDVDVEVSGDGKFVKVTPKAAFTAGADGNVAIAVHASYLVDLDRAGLRLSGGRAGGTVDATVRANVTNAAGTIAAGDTWEVSRLSLPLPTIMPSYNQIGFDSLHYLLGMVESTSGHSVAWMVGAKLRDTDNTTVIDPTSKAIFPLDVTNAGGIVTLVNRDGLDVQIMNTSIPMKTFRVSARLGTDGAAIGDAAVSGNTQCAGIPLYGSFLQELGLCNPQTDIISVYGAAKITRFAPATIPAAGNVAFTVDANGITATLTGAAIKPDEHLASILVIDAATGSPVTLGYGLETTRTTNADGTLATISVPTKGHTLPAQMRVHLMIDTSTVAHGALAAP
jgi:outer membrane protein assembly factor BamB